MSYTVTKLEDPWWMETRRKSRRCLSTTRSPKGQCGLHPSHKWAVIDDVWGLKDAFRTFGEAEAYVAELMKEEAASAAKEATEAASRFKGTPGPWEVVRHYEIRSSVTLMTIADVVKYESGVARDNARLIAAAPDLLAVVQSALSVGYDENGWQAKARAALKKAGIEE